MSFFNFFSFMESSGILCSFISTDISQEVLNLFKKITKNLKKIETDTS